MNLGLVVALIWVMGALLIIMRFYTYAPHVNREWCTFRNFFVWQIVVLFVSLACLSVQSGRHRCDQEETAGGMLATE